MHKAPQRKHAGDDAVSLGEGFLRMMLKALAPKATPGEWNGVTLPVARDAQQSEKQMHETLEHSINCVSEEFSSL